jgi:hypothetical protein
MITKEDIILAKKIKIELKEYLLIMGPIYHNMDILNFLILKIAMLENKILEIQQKE